MADQHENDNGEVVRGQRVRASLSGDSSNDQYSGNDLSGIQADDALLDALGGKSPELNVSLVDDELNALLVAWRKEVDSQPYEDLVDTDTAVATIAAAARHTPSSRHRFLIPLASAAAVLAIAFTGVSLVARDAQPGDALWGLTRVLYSEHARSIEAAVAVRTDLDVAEAALSQGRITEAKDALEKARAVLPAVSDNDGKSELAQKHESLLGELTSTPATPTSPTGQTSSTSPSSPSTTVPPSTTTPPTTTVPTTEATTTTPSVPSGSTGGSEVPVPNEPGQVTDRENPPAAADPPTGT